MTGTEINRHERNKKQKDTWTDSVDLNVDVMKLKFSKFLDSL